MQIKPEIKIVIENDQPITTSRNVAENFEKNHRDVLKAIDEFKDGVAQNFADLFYLTTYKHPQNKQVYREYYMTKDGFTLLAMGFTGKKALEFKLAYIDQFNKMEEQIKQQLDTSQLSPELQMFNKIFQTVASQELKTKQLEEKVDGISSLIAMNSKDWRAEVVAILRKIAIKQGGFDKYAEVTNESYIRLEAKGRCNLNIRLENRKKNMIAQGLGKTTVKKANKLDVIEQDHRLKEIYVSVVKDMAIKYEVWEEK